MKLVTSKKSPFHTNSYQGHEPDARSGPMGAVGAGDHVFPLKASL